MKDSESLNRHGHSIYKERVAEENIWRKSCLINFRVKSGPYILVTILLWNGGL